MKYKLFGRKTGLYVSELILGGSMLGTRKGYGANREEANKILGAYTDAGGNMIDIADMYQFGEAEEIIGDFISHNRNNYIICSKYTRGSELNPTLSNSGNHRKSMRQAVEASLKRLKTDFIDIYMPHFDDGVTPIEEIIRGLEDLVTSGKVVYTGLANFPAWKVAAIASSTRLSTVQIEYNLSQRTADRELIPMAANFGLGTMMYSPLAGGLLTGKYRKGETGRINLTSGAEVEENASTKAILDYLIHIAEELGSSPGQIALAWVLAKGGFPIIGPRMLAHLVDNLKAKDISLSEEQVNNLNKLSTVKLGYPHDLLASVQTQP